MQITPAANKRVRNKEQGLLIYRFSWLIRGIFFFKIIVFIRMYQKFCNILERARFWRVYHVTEEVQSEEGTCCGWLYFSSWNVVLCFIACGIWKPWNVVYFGNLRYEFGLTIMSWKPLKICCAKGESKVDNNRVTRWFKKFRSGARASKAVRTKTADSECVLQMSEANPTSNTRRISGELGKSQSSEVRHFTWNHIIIWKLLVLK